MLIVLFLFSCSDTTETSKEKSELDRCINANLSLFQNMNIERLEKYPIWITGFSDVKIEFNPRIAKEREYRYYVFNEENQELFNEAMQLFVGKHDFRNFARVLDTDNVDTRRTVKKINVTSRGKVIMCEIKGTSFLWHQVRKMIGAASDVTYGRKEINDIEKGLSGEKIDFTMAKAEFLTLTNIKYNNVEIDQE